MLDLILCVAGFLLLVLALANHFARELACKKRIEDQSLFITYQLTQVCAKAVSKRKRKCIACPFIEMFGYLEPTLKAEHERWLES